VTKPILIHAILETAEGVKNVDAIASCSPRMHGISLGPADLAASRAMKTTRVGGGHPEYKVIADAVEGGAPRRPISRTFGITPSPKWSTPAPPPASRPFTDPSATSRTPPPARRSSVTLFAWLRRRLVAAPSQITIAKKVFSPDAAEVAFARRVLEAMPDGTGAVMIDGRMQDDATWKQAKVMVDLARQVAASDPDYGKIYGF